jgi:hypothetical protein
MYSLAQNKWPWTVDGFTVYINVYEGKHFLLAKIVRNGDVMNTSFMDGFGRQPGDFLTVRTDVGVNGNAHTPT